MSLGLSSGAVGGGAPPGPPGLAPLGPSGGWVSGCALIGRGGDDGTLRGAVPRAFFRHAGATGAEPGRR